MTGVVYLAGPIRGCSYRGAMDWREYVKGKFPPEVSVLSPMRGKEFLRQKRRIADAYPDHPLSTDTAIVGRDRSDMRRCDVVLANFLGATEISLGTGVELGWADAWRKPVVAVMEQDNPHNHSFVRAIKACVTDNLDEAIEMALSILGVERAVK